MWGDDVKSLVVRGYGWNTISPLYYIGILLSILKSLFGKGLRRFGRGRAAATPYVVRVYESKKKRPRRSGALLAARVKTDLESNLRCRV